MKTFQQAKRAERSTQQVEQLGQSLDVSSLKRELQRLHGRINLLEGLAGTHSLIAPNGDTHEFVNGVLRRKSSGSVPAVPAHTHVKVDVTDFAHTHVKSDITDFAHTHVKSDITDFAHTHTKADITDFAHTHGWSDITSTPNLYVPNVVVNGAFNVWQRNTSFTDVTSSNFYTADLHCFNRVGDVAGLNVSRSTDAPTGFEYSAKVQRASGNTSTAGVVYTYAHESSKSIPLRSKQVAVSLYVKKGADYSGGDITFALFSGTGTNQRVESFTGSTSVASTTITPTTSWVRYSFTGTFGASITQMGVKLTYTPSGTAGADDSIYITGLQIETGSAASTYVSLPWDMELYQCMRYYEKTFNYTTVPASSADFAGVLSGWVGASPTASLGGVHWNFKVPKMASPDIITYTPYTTGSGFRSGATGLEVPVTVGFINTYGCIIYNSGTGPSGGLDRWDIHAVAKSEF